VFRCTSKLRRRLERGTGFLVATELLQEIAADARQQVIGFQRGLPRQPVDNGKPGCRTVHHPDGDGPVQLDDWRMHQRRQFGVERGDAPPIGVLGRVRLGMAGHDRRLQHVETPCAAEFVRPRQRL
jgi:hypothetical protein